MIRKSGIILVLILIFNLSLVRNEQFEWEIFENKDLPNRNEDKAELYEEIKNDKSDKDLDELWDFMDANNDQVIKIDAVNDQLNINNQATNSDTVVSDDTESIDEDINEDSSRENGLLFSNLKNLFKRIFRKNENQDTTGSHCPFMKNFREHHRRRQNNWQNNPFTRWWENRKHRGNQFFRGNWLQNIRNIFNPSNEDDSNSSPFTNFAHNFINNMRQNRNDDHLRQNMTDMWFRFRNFTVSPHHIHANENEIHDVHNLRVYHSNQTNGTSGESWLARHGFRNKTLFKEYHSKLICMLVTGAKKIKFFDFIQENFIQNNENSSVTIKMVFINKVLTCCAEEEPSDCMILLRQERINKFCDENMPLRPWAFYPLRNGLEDSIRSTCCSDRDEGWHQCIHGQMINFWNSIQE